MTQNQSLIGFIATDPRPNSSETLDFITPGGQIHNIWAPAAIRGPLMQSQGQTVEIWLNPNSGQQIPEVIGFYLLKRQDLRYPKLWTQLQKKTSLLARQPWRETLELNLNLRYS